MKVSVHLEPCDTMADSPMDVENGNRLAESIVDRPQLPQQPFRLMMRTIAAAWQLGVCGQSVFCFFRSEQWSSRLHILLARLAFKVKARTARLSSARTLPKLEKVQQVIA